MKKIILFIGMVMFLVAGSMAQRALPVDTLAGAETINFASMQNAKAVTCVATNVGGTSDGTLTLYGSNNGTTWVFLNAIGGANCVASPKASITGADLNQVTITTGLTAAWQIESKKWAYHRLAAVGTTGDTTKLAVEWSK